MVWLLRYAGNNSEDSCVNLVLPSSHSWLRCSAGSGRIKVDLHTDYNQDHPFQLSSFRKYLLLKPEDQNAKPPAHKLYITFHTEIKECIQSGHLALFHSQFLLFFFFFLILFDKTLNGRKSFWGISKADGFAVNSHPQVYKVTKPTPQWPPLEGAEESNPSSIICWICTKDAKFFQQMFSSDSSGEKVSLWGSGKLTVDSSGIQPLPPLTHI